MALHAPTVGLFVDFDGTAAEEIASSRLLERFALGNWPQYDQLLELGHITFKECILKQYSMLVGSREEMMSFCRRELQLRAGFSQFVQFCHERNYEMTIVSEALDFLIEALLEREKIAKVKVYCDHAHFKENRVSVNLPHFREDCLCTWGF